MDWFLSYEPKQRMIQKSSNTILFPLAIETDYKDLFSLIPSFYKLMNMNLNFLCFRLKVVLRISLMKDFKRLNQLILQRWMLMVTFHSWNMHAVQKITLFILCMYNFLAKQSIDANTFWVRINDPNNLYRPTHPFFFTLQNIWPFSIYIPDFLLLLEP